MSSSSGLNNLKILRPNSFPPVVDVSSMSERKVKILKTELKNLRQSIVSGLAGNTLEEIVPMLSLLAYHKCDPMYKYPSFDFISMLIYCYLVSYFIYLFIYLSMT